MSILSFFPLSFPLVISQKKKEMQYFHHSPTAHSSEGKKIHALSVLTVSGEIDCPLGDVHIHEVVDDPALDVSLVLVHQDLLARVEDLEEAEVALQGVVQRLVLLLVVPGKRKKGFARVGKVMEMLTLTYFPLHHDLFFFYLLDAGVKVLENLVLVASDVVRARHFYLGKIGRLLDAARCMQKLIPLLCCL